MNVLQLSGTTKLAGDQDAAYLQILNQKSYWAAAIKNFLQAYMKGKNFAPVGTVGQGHWRLLAQINKSGDEILVLDSSGEQVKWVDIDEIAEKFVHYYNFGNEIIVGFDMLIFKENEEGSNMTINSLDDFIKEQKDIINKIG